MTSTPVPEKYSIKGFPSILTINGTTNDFRMDIGRRILKQPLILQSVRIEFSSVAAALAKELVYLQLPFFNSSYLVDENPGYAYIPIFVGDTQVTIMTGMNLPIQVDTDIQQVFRVRILNSAFAPVADLLRFTAQFTFLE